MTQTKTPVLFISHSNPMLVFDKESEQNYRNWAQQLPEVKALLFFSAHWQTAELTFGESGQHTRLVYDFFGFPDELYRMQYPAPGAAWLTETVETLLEEKIASSERGLDHGIWIPLLHMWPEADIPILQMSLPAQYDNQQLYDLGRRLAPLREQGVMICGGGTLSHNLREGLTKHHDYTPAWVRDFDKWLATTLSTHPQELLDWENKAPNAQRNHPTPEHFLPLLITLGAADADEQVRFPITGFDMADPRCTGRRSFVPADVPSVTYG